MMSHPEHAPPRAVDRTPATERPRRYLTELADLADVLSPAELARLQPVAERYAFRLSRYYYNLIDWQDPADPLRRIVIPAVEELNDWGQLDASEEFHYTVAPGVQHKYPATVLLLCNEVCGAYCRYCFRKRLFMPGNDEAHLDVGPGLAYIAAHPEVTNVLLTGGDPLLLSTRRLADILDWLATIDHVRIVRLGSKMPAFEPSRLLEDEALQDLLRRHNRGHQRLHLMAHFDHPRELTPLAVAGLRKFQDCGVVCVNQCPLIRGVNDRPAVLRELFEQLSYVGCPPYYLFQGRPTAGNEPYCVPLVEGLAIYLEAIAGIPGLAKRARFVMSHATGKIEILGVDHQCLYLRYHRAFNPRDRGRFFACRRDDRACWLDELEPVRLITAA